MSKKRGNGQGGAYKRGRTWTAFWTKCVDDGGIPLYKRERRTKGGFATKKEALEYIPTLAGSKVISKDVLTLKQVYDKWEPTHKVSHSTINCYRAAFKYFSPLWNTMLPQIDIDDLQECVDECGKGKRTRQNMKAICGLLYKYAIPRPHLVPHKLNLANFIVVGGGETAAKQGFTNEQLNIICEHINSVPYGDLIYAQCYLGFRPTEFLTLDAAGYDRKEKAFTGGAKTEAGKDRVVTVSPKIQAIVDKYTKDKLAGPIFTSPQGKQLSLKEYRVAFYAALEQMGIDNPLLPDGKHTLSPHSCRHTFATLMKTVQAPDTDKLKLIGHTSSAMLRYYQDVALADLRAITDVI